MATTAYFTAQQRAKIISFRGRMPASQVANKMGCLVSRIKKIWNRSKKSKLKTSHLTGFAVLENREIAPLPPEPLIEHGFLLLELADHQCCWPLIGRDEDGRLRFCGAPRHKNRAAPSYCEFHAAMACDSTANPWTDEGVEYMVGTITDPGGQEADDLLLDEIAEAA